MKSFSNQALFIKEKMLEYAIKKNNGTQKQR